MTDPLSIAGAIVTFGELAMTIKESIDKVGDNKEILANLEKEVSDTVKELKSLAQRFGDEEPTGELLTALENLTGQLEVISSRCQALAQSKGVSGFVKAWLKRDKIEAEINKLKERRKYCCDQFQLFSLARVEGTTARTEEYTVQIKVTTARTEETAVRTETNTIQLITLARKEELQKWFQALDMREKQSGTYALRHNDTGRWLLEGTEFAKWKEEPGCLWIRGNSGTGKSVLSSIAIDYLFEYRSAKVANSHPATPTLGIAYFYFDFRDEKKQLLENMLRSIIMQLSEQSPTPYSVLDQHFNSCQGGKFPTCDDLLAMLDTILGQFTGTYIVLDALDECNEPDELVQFISTLRGWGKPVHLLVASQPHTIFLGVFGGAPIVDLELKTTHADILQYVNSKLQFNSKLKHLKAKDAAPKIVDKSNGMFRMAACLLQELARKRINPNIDKILAELPNDLFGIYTRFLHSTDEDEFVYVAALLRWLAFSARPITLLELDEALAINFSGPDRWVFKPENREQAKVVCGLLEGLVLVGSDTSTCRRAFKREPVVTLAHSSVKDYIMSKNFLDEYKHDLGEPSSHTFLAQSCVAYLLHFETNPLNADTLPHYPLARYAAQFWSRHLLQCHDRGVLQRSTMHLLKEGCPQYVALNCVCAIDWPWEAPDWSRHTPSPLDLCSRVGYIEGVQFLLATDVTDVYEVDAALDHCADANALDSALQGAASKGHMDIVHLLLKHGADVNGVYGKSGCALYCAVQNSHVDVVRTLLENGADVNAVIGDGDSALQEAVQNDHVDIVRSLLECGADVNAVDGDSVLQWAAWNGHINIIHMLLDRGTDVNAVGGTYGSALQAASSGGHVNIVHILLNLGADVKYGSALHKAAWKGHVDIVRILLKRGADVNAEGRKYGSALQAAALKGQVDVVRILLDHGANVNAVGESVLQGAAWYGHTDIVRILLEKGADVYAASKKYGSALQAATLRGELDVVRLLLDCGADVNALGENVLEGAARYGHTDVVRVLLEHGAGMNTVGGRYGSALKAVSARGHKEVVELLEEHKVHESGNKSH
ncbi:ankyrin repeat-containing domain protein [Mycena polygramma]|nr:ankyrin repeat-containing domain protein [Mycena polygramma]